MTKEIDATNGDAFELTWPDGSVLRLRWDRAQKGVKVSAESFPDRCATALIIRPTSANGVILQAE